MRMLSMTPRSGRFRKMRLAYVLLLLNAVTGGVDVVAAQADNPASHASIKAYPEAVISATDPQTGIKVTVDPDGVGLTATDRSGRVLWKTDVVKEIGAPPVGEPVMRHVSIKRGVVTIILGKHRVAEAGLETGKVALLGDN